MTLPNLIVPGAAKSGTTSLHDCLRQHPNIFMSERKEPQFFSREPTPELRERYRSLFEASGGFAVRGESSTSYMVVPEAPLRMREALDRPRLIFVLRNPVERVISHYRWLQSLGLERRALRAAFQADREATPSMDESIFNTGNFCFYFQHSAYGSALERYLTCFDRTQMRIVTFEGFTQHFDEVMRGCFRFLGVDEGVRVTRSHSNETRHVTHLRSRAWYLMRSVTSRVRWVRRFRRVYMAPAGLALRAVERLYPGAAARLGGPSPEDRIWLAQQLAGEVEKLRATWNEDFAEWSRDFPV